MPRDLLAGCTVVLGVLLFAGGTDGTSACGQITLTDITRSSGLTFRHTDGGSGQRYIVETVTAGLVTLDYNGDGLLDIYFVNGSPLRGSPRVSPPPRNALYRNDGNGRFTDVTEHAGVGDTGFGLGATAGDYDNDGHPDLYVSNYGPNVLYHNNGDGTFTDVTARAGVGRGAKVGAGVAFLDMDADGDLDLYAANYVKFTYANHVVRHVDGFPTYAGPKEFPPEPDSLFRNNGDGTFTDVSAESGVGAHAATGMGMVAGDFDDDGDTDVFVLNDVAGNFLFRNDGRGHFDEVGLEAGVAFNLNGHELGSMGVDCADYDNDGRLDLFMTSYSGEMPVLYRNTGDGIFEDVTFQTGAGEGLFPHVNWGTGFGDFDNDGDRDLFVACGHLQDNIEQWDDSTAYRVANVLLMNDGGKFVDVSAQAGDGMKPVESSRGVGVDDLDNDGDLDVVVLNARSTPTLLRNDSPAGNHWLDVELRGTHCSRDAVGSRVRVVAGDLEQMDEVHSGRGYQGHFGTRLHFGLGQRGKVDRVEVRWMGGGVEVIDHPPVDRLLTITQSVGP